MIYAVDKAFTGELGLDLNVFHFPSVPFPTLLCNHLPCFCKCGLAHAQLVKNYVGLMRKLCWFIYPQFILSKGIWNSEKEF